MRLDGVRVRRRDFAPEHGLPRHQIRGRAGAASTTYPFQLALRPDALVVEDIHLRGRRVAFGIMQTIVNWVAGPRFALRAGARRRPRLSRRCGRDDGHTLQRLQQQPRLLADVDEVLQLQDQIGRVVRIEIARQSTLAALHSDTGTADPHPK